MAAGKDRVGLDLTSTLVSGGLMAFGASGGGYAGTSGGIMGFAGSARKVLQDIEASGGSKMSSMMLGHNYGGGTIDPSSTVNDVNTIVNTGGNNLGSDTSESNTYGLSDNLSRIQNEIKSNQSGAKTSQTNSVNNPLGSAVSEASQLSPTIYNKAIQPASSNHSSSSGSSYSETGYSGSGYSGVSYNSTQYNDAQYQVSAAMDISTQTNGVNPGISSNADRYIHESSLSKKVIPQHIHEFARGSAPGNMGVVGRGDSNFNSQLKNEKKYR